MVLEVPKVQEPLPPLSVLLTFTFNMREVPLGTSVAPEVAVIEMLLTAFSTSAFVPTSTNRSEVGVIITPVVAAAARDKPSVLVSRVRQSLTFGEAPNSILGRIIAPFLGSKGTVPGVSCPGSSTVTRT
jgi:hypothetical protein